MTSDPDIHRAAKLVIDKYGEDALQRAAGRAGELLKAGDIIGAETWKQILTAIGELKRRRREGQIVS